VHQADAPTTHGDDALAREVDAGKPVVVTLHGHHRGDLAQLVEHRHAGDVPGVEDEVAPRKGRRHRRRQLGQYLPHMGVGDHADADGAAQMAMAW
jgi:hypothetical protein